MGDTRTQKVTISQFAAELGISRQAAHRGVRRCAIPVDADGLLDLEAGLALYRSRTRQRVKARLAADPQAIPADDLDPEYQVSRAKREAAEAEIAVLTLGQLAGTLFERQAVERAVFEAARGLRDQLSSCAGPLGALVAGITSAQECEAEIRREHRYLLDSFVRELDQKVESL